MPLPCFCLIGGGVCWFLHFSFYIHVEVRKSSLWAGLGFLMVMASPDFLVPWISCSLIVLCSFRIDLFSASVSIQMWNSHPSLNPTQSHSPGPLTRQSSSLELKEREKLSSGTTQRWLVRYFNLKSFLCVVGLLPLTLSAVSF